MLVVSTVSGNFEIKKIRNMISNNELERKSFKISYYEESLRLFTDSDGINTDYEDTKRFRVAFEKQGRIVENVLNAKVEERVGIKEKYLSYYETKSGQMVDPVVIVPKENITIC